MGFGAALNNTEISLLSAGMGWPADVYVPNEYWLHISMKAVADDGSGIVYPNFTTDPVNNPYDPDTYWPQKMPQWGELQDDNTKPVDGQPPPPDDWTRIWSTPTKPVIFPTPTIEWWPDNTWIYPFLADSWDPSVLVPLWTWKVFCGRVDPGQPLVFDKLTNPAAYVTGRDIRIGFSREKGGKASQWTLKDWYYGALGTVLKPLNFPTYSPPTDWWVAMTNAGHKEPNASYPAGGDPNYVRKHIDNFTPIDTGGTDGSAFFATQDLFEWKQAAPTENNPNNPCAWDTDMTAEIYDSAASGSGTLWFSFAGTNVRSPIRNRYFDVPVGALVWRCD